jgi:hypothetical protein
LHHHQGREVETHSESADGRARSIAVTSRGNAGPSQKKLQQTPQDQHFPLSGLHLMNECRVCLSLRDSPYTNSDNCSEIVSVRPSEAVIAEVM